VERSDGRGREGEEEGGEQEGGWREVTGADADVAADAREGEVTAHDGGSGGGVGFALYVNVAWIRPVGRDSCLGSSELHQSCKISPLKRIISV
jgi:hypothetical protein